ncbi:hypothetical protein AHAS_Ahas04G0116700 [Arachis hypogaea]
MNFLLKHRNAKRGSVTSGDYKKQAQMLSRPFESKLPESHTVAQEESKIGTRRKLPVIRGKSSKGSSTTHVVLRRKERPVVVDDSDDDDNVPITRRRR